MSAFRKFLWLQERPCDTDVPGELSRAQWEFRHYPPDAQFDAWLRDCRVGIVSIDDAAPAWLDLLEANAYRWRDVELIAIVSPTAMQDERVRRFITACCIDYQTRPVDMARLLFALGHADGMAALARHTRESPFPESDDANLIGESRLMAQLRRDLIKVAQTDAPVMITGESGTGKELIARAVHQMSARRHAPIIAVNCASLPPTLIHAELFGYEKGAFTGAQKRRVGHLEMAHRGTIFLDEIGDLDLELQALLLRFLEEKTVRRVGGDAEIGLDVRVIAATHVDIEAAVAAGKFRDDLYYRLNVLRLHMPPLRERAGDAVLLAHAFLARSSRERAKAPTGFSACALRAISAYDWPGNVRELMNRVRRATIMSDGPYVTASDLRLDAGRVHASLPDLETARSAAERRAVVAALEHADWSPSKAATLLGVSRATMYRLLGRYEIQVDETGTFRKLSPSAMDPSVDEPPTAKQDVD